MRARNSISPKVWKATPIFDENGERIFKEFVNGEAYEEASKYLPTHKQDDSLCGFVLFTDKTRMFQWGTRQVLGHVVGSGCRALGPSLAPPPPPLSL